MSVLFFFSFIFQIYSDTCAVHDNICPLRKPDDQKTHRTSGVGTPEGDVCAVPKLPSLRIFLRVEWL